MMDNNTRQVFHTQGFENPQRHAVLTATINEKAESASHLPRFFSVSDLVLGLRVVSQLPPDKSGGLLVGNEYRRFRAIDCIGNADD
jgi:hypothetical protein